MRRTIVDIRRRVEFINNELSEKFKVSVVKTYHKYNVESNNGSRTERAALTPKEVDLFLDGLDYGLIVARGNGVLPRKTAENPLQEPLTALLRVFLEGRNYNTQNPYTRPEVKAALQALKEVTGFAGDWQDAADPNKKA